MHGQTANQTLVALRSTSGEHEKGGSEGKTLNTRSIRQDEGGMTSGLAVCVGNFRSDFSSDFNLNDSKHLGCR